MKRFATVLAFSVTSLMSLGRAAATTPVETIQEADKIELFFGADTSLNYLQSVKQALAERQIDLDFTDIKFDMQGKLVNIAFEVKHRGELGAATEASITDTAGAYLYVDFQG